MTPGATYALAQFYQSVSNLHADDDGKPCAYCHSIACLRLELWLKRAFITRQVWPQGSRISNLKAAAYARGPQARRSTAHGYRH